MANTKKLIQAAAGLGGEALNVEDVFSTYLYEGTGSAQTITNGIDLDGEGGLVWAKVRSQTQNHVLFDTERGATKYLKSNATSAETTRADTLTSFNSNGFSLGNDSSGALINTSGQNYASWTFRKAPKFFDVQTFTATSSDNVISHNLSSEVGMIFLKQTSSTNNWWVYHRSLGTGNNSMLQLNTTSAQLGYRVDTPNNHFSSVSSSSVTLTSLTGTVEYVMYLFAHNDGDGDFGPTGDQDIIKCGSYTGNGSTDGPEIDLGFEPQWIITKAVNASGKDWNIYDSMRGFTAGSGDFRIKANTTDTESVSLTHYRPTATGFKLETTSTDHNGSGTNYIYIAIRRGPMAVPESATEVFAVQDGRAAESVNGNSWTSGFPIDAFLQGWTTGGTNHYLSSRITDGEMATNSTVAETGATFNFDDMDGLYLTGSASANSSPVGYMWRRAPSFFDVVAYTGNGTAGRTVSHNLGVAPEMIWVKQRDTTRNWCVYHKDMGNTHYILLDSRSASVDGFGTGFWDDTTPSDTNFTLGSNSFVNQSSGTYIAYLFASVAGISKVGSYTGNGSTQTIDCGFSSGARFILIKRTDSTGDWYVWDTERGIVAGNDPYLELNSTDAEVTSTDWVDPDNSGFIVNGTTINASSAEYIFYAVA